MKNGGQDSLWNATATVRNLRRRSQLAGCGKHRENLEGMTPSSQPLSWKIWTRQKPMLQDSMPRKFGRRQTVQTSHFRSQMEQSKLFGRDHGIRKSTSMRDELARSEELSGDLRGSSDGSQPIDAVTDDREARNDFWSKGITLIVSTLKLEFSSVCRRKNHSQSHCDFFDMISTTHTCLARKPER